VLVAAVDCPGNILHREHPEASGLGEQCLFFWAKPETANLERHAVARAPGTMFYLAALVDGIMVGFDGTIAARLRDVMGMVFAGAFLKSFYTPCERRSRNT
jgi:hypothetical protein